MIKLIRIDGDPVYRRIEGTDLERIVNTKVLIVRDSADIHYLKVRDGWMEAYGLMGDWSVRFFTIAASNAIPSGQPSSVSILVWLATRAGGEVLPDF